LTCKPSFIFEPSSVKSKTPYVQRVEAIAALLREISILALVSLAAYVAVRSEGRERLALLPVVLSAVTSLAISN